MISRRGVATAVFVAGVVIAALSGCSSTPGCNVSQPAGPLLDLDLSSWFAAHPDSALNVCFDGHCEDVPLARAHATPTPPPSPAAFGDVRVEGASPLNDLKTHYPVTVTTAAGDPLPSGQAKLEVSTTKQPNGCAPPVHVANATLSSTGRLSTTK